MSKKTLLNETTIRRFMKLAKIPGTFADLIKETEEENNDTTNTDGTTGTTETTDTTTTTDTTETTGTNEGTNEVIEESENNDEVVEETTESEETVNEEEETVEETVEETADIEEEMYGDRPDGDEEGDLAADDGMATITAEEAELLMRLGEKIAAAQAGEEGPADAEMDDAGEEEMPPEMDMDMDAEELPGEEGDLLS